MASTSAAGFAKNMSKSRAEALQALLDSLAPGAESGDGKKHGQDQARDRIGELLGEVALPDTTRRNEKGELLNEEGLPIVDIVELVPDGPTSLDRPPALDDADYIPLWALSPAEKARMRAERDRILDMLEEEERLEQEKTEAEECERSKAELEKRKQAADAELDALKKARDVQKKMGKALLRNLAEAREREEKEKRELEQAEMQAREERKKLKPRKSVSFADLPPDHEHQPANSVPSSFDWTDRPRTPPKLTKDEMIQGPLRMDVVERVPSLLRGPKSPPPPTQIDSDDEIDPGSPVPADSDDGDIIHSDRSDTDSSPHRHRLEDTDDSDYGMVDDKEPIEWDHDGYSFAQHQREIALAYYEKRATVGAEAFAVMRNHDHTEEENENKWDQPDVPLEATLTSPPPKPPVSRFRTSMSSSSSLPSRSLGGSILPASQSSALKSAIRLGKLDNNELFGGEEGESDGEMDPAAQEVLEILKKGDVVNLGPTLPSSVATETVATSIPHASTSSGDAVALPTTSSLGTSVPNPSNVSQFTTIARSSTPSASLISPDSSLSTPVSTVDRSSPKFTSRVGTPIAVPTRSPRTESSQMVPEGPSTPMPGMIVRSPSFVAPGVITSSSFPGSSNSAPLAPAFRSMVIESPSFQSPSSTLVGTPASTSPSSAASPPAPSVTMTAPLSASVIERRPIVAHEVCESSAVSRSNGSTPAKEKKMSRFLVERS